LWKKETIALEEANKKKFDEEKIEEMKSKEQKDEERKEKEKKLYKWIDDKYTQVGDDEVKLILGIYEDEKKLAVISEDDLNIGDEVGLPINLGSSGHKKNVFNN